jgi:6-phospho-3-hexuloisomerase
MSDGLERADAHLLERIRQSLETSQIPNRKQFLDDIRQAEKIFIYGVGRSGVMAKAFAIRLVQLGLKVFFIGETITPIVEPGDLVVIVSNTGETMSAIQTANIVRRVGAKVTAITTRPHSKLAHAASTIIHLNVKHDETDTELSPLGTVFEDSALIFLDGIVADLIKEMGETAMQFGFSHRLGRWRNRPARPMFERNAHG